MRGWRLLLGGRGSKTRTCLIVSVLYREGHPSSADVWSL
jgi:hypothetical protein